MATRVTIRVSAFQPFESRRGYDTVIRLEFRYDADLVALLKAAGRAAKALLYRRHLVGWLAEHHCWFCERAAWPSVRWRLLDAGYLLTGPESGQDDTDDTDDDDEADDRQRAAGPTSGASSTPVDWPARISRWYRQLCLDFHPDRGGSKEAMQAINEAHERLKKALGIH
jgi:hypothetical protein